MLPRAERRHRLARRDRFESSPAEPSAHYLLALQRAVGNRAVAAAVLSRRRGVSLQRCGSDTGCGCVPMMGDTIRGTDISVQRDRASQDEESAPTEGGAEESGVGDATCELLPDAAVVALVRAYFAVRYPLASRHLVHYLEGSGSPFIEDVPGLFAANPRGTTRVAEQIRSRGGSGSGQLIGRTVDTAVIRQRDYDSDDWRLSLGGIDQEHYSKPHIIEKKNNPRAASYASR